jgi:hypothetical protein
MIERRVDHVRRKRVSEMSPEEVRQRSLPAEGEETMRAYIEIVSHSGRRNDDGQVAERTRAYGKQLQPNQGELLRPD